MPRFNSDARSVSGMTTYTGLPDSRPSHALNCSSELVTNRPCSSTGIPCDLQRFATETGSPRYSAISFHLQCLGLGYRLLGSLLRHTSFRCRILCEREFK